MNKYEIIFYIYIYRNNQNKYNYFKLIKYLIFNFELLQLNI